MDAGEIISFILKGYKDRNRNMPSFVGNDSNTSFYISMKRGNNQCPVQIRLSNHGTYLRTWVDRTNLENSNERLQDPSHCINISIVFIDDGKDLTNDCEGQTNCDNCQITPCVPQTFEGQNDLGHPFQVQQYTYCSRIIRKRYLKGIVGAIIRALRTGKYTDPLSKVAKRKAANKTLDSSYPITLQNNKTNKNESKNMNKKNSIRLTESDLKRVISESVKKVLNEYNEILDNPNIDKQFGPTNYKPKTKKTQNAYSWDAFDNYKSAQMDTSELEDLQNMYSGYDGLKSYQDLVDEYKPINDFKTLKNENKETKQIVKLTESQLRGMITESVKKVLKESCWYGDTKPFEVIRNAAEEIMDKFQYTQEDDYEPYDAYDFHWSIYEWAKKISNDAEGYIHCNSSNTSINGGENW